MYRYEEFDFHNVVEETVHIGGVETPCGMGGDLWLKISWDFKVRVGKCTKEISEKLERER
jgi:hypothetical protein